MSDVLKLSREEVQAAVGKWENVNVVQNVATAPAAFATMIVRTIPHTQQQAQQDLITIDLGNARTEFTRDMLGTKEEWDVVDALRERAVYAARLNFRKAAAEAAEAAAKAAG